MSIKDIATKVAARILWAAGLIINEAGTLLNLIGRQALRLAHHLDSDLERFW